MITLQSALNDLKEALDEEGVLENESVSGSLAVLEALINGEASSFDGTPVIKLALVGINMKE